MTTVFTELNDAGESGAGHWTNERGIQYNISPLRLRGDDACLGVVAPCGIDLVGVDSTYWMLTKSLCARLVELGDIR